MQVKVHGRFDATVAFESVLDALSWQTMMWPECVPSTSLWWCRPMTRS